MASPELEPRTVTVSGSGKLHNGYRYSWSVVLTPSRVAENTVAGIMRKLAVKLDEVERNIARLESWLKTITVYEVDVNTKTGKVTVKKIYGPNSPTLDRLVSNFSLATEKLASLNPGGMVGDPYTIVRRVLNTLDTYVSWRKRFAEMLVKLYDLGSKGTFYKLGDTHAYVVFKPDQLLELDDRYVRLKNYGVILARITRVGNEFTLETYTVTGIKKNWFEVTNPGAADQVGIDVRALLKNIVGSVNIVSSVETNLRILAKLEREYLSPIDKLRKAGLGALADLLAYIFRNKIADVIQLYKELKQIKLQGGGLCRYYNDCDKVRRRLGFEPYIIITVDDSMLKELKDKIEVAESLLKQLSSYRTPTVEAVYTPSGTLSDEIVNKLVEYLKARYPVIESMGNKKLASLVRYALLREKWLAMLATLSHASLTELRVNKEIIKLNNNNFMRVIGDKEIKDSAVGNAIEKLLDSLSGWPGEINDVLEDLVGPLVAVIAIHSLNAFIDKLEEKIKSGKSLTQAEKAILGILYNCSTNSGLVKRDYYLLCMVSEENNEVTFYDFCINRTSLNTALTRLDNKLRRLKKGVVKPIMLEGAILHVRLLIEGVEAKSIEYFDDMVAKLVERFKKLCEELQQKKEKSRKGGSSTQQRMGGSRPVPSPPSQPSRPPVIVPRGPAERQQPGSRSQVVIKPIGAAAEGSRRTRREGGSVVIPVSASGGGVGASSLRSKSRLRARSREAAARYAAGSSSILLRTQSVVQHSPGGWPVFNLQLHIM